MRLDVSNTAAHADASIFKISGKITNFKITNHQRKVKEHNVVIRIVIRLSLNLYTKIRLIQAAVGTNGNLSVF